MDERARILVDEISQIRSQYVDQVGIGGRKVWPKAIKERINELQGIIDSAKKIESLTGIPVETLYSWKAKIKKTGFKALTVVKQKGPVTVTVAKPDRNDRKDSNATVTVTTPKGYRIEGLTPEAAIDFLLKVRA